MKVMIVLCLIVVCVSSTADVHHSREYLMLTSYKTGAKGSALAGLSYDSNKGGRVYFMGDCVRGIIQSYRCYNVRGSYAFQKRTEFRLDVGGCDVQLSDAGNVARLTFKPPFVHISNMDTNSKIKFRICS